jgi:hypothetical protein
VITVLYKVASPVPLVYGMIAGILEAFGKRYSAQAGPGHGVSGGAFVLVYITCDPSGPTFDLDWILRTTYLFEMTTTSAAFGCDSLGSTL